MIHRGEIWWADLPEPEGSEPGSRRPVLIVQADWANGAGIRTVAVVVLTSNLSLADAPGNVRVEPADSGLPRPSVINVTQILTLNLRQLDRTVGRLRPSLLRAVDQGLRIFLDL